MLIYSEYKSPFCIFTLAMAGVLFFTQPAPAATLAEKNSAMPETLFTHTKPQCIGRYLIDVPESFNNSLKNMVFIDGFKIESKRLYKPAFQQKIMLREQELRDSTNKPGNEPQDAPFLKEAIHLPDGRGIIFDHNWDGKPDTYRQLEAHVYDGMTAFTLTTKIRDYSAPKNKNEKIDYLGRGFTEAQSNTKPARLAAMTSLISRLSARKDEEIPTDKGVCIPDGFIKEDGGKQDEKVTFSYETSDFYLGIYTNNTYVGSGDTLMSRGSGIKDELAQAHRHTIKYGELHPGGIPAQQWLSAGMQQSNHIEGRFPNYEFELYANESIASLTKPWLNVGLSNTDKQSKYTESQMVEIWDRLVSTLRYRPNAF